MASSNNRRSALSPTASKQAVNNTSEKRRLSNTERHLYEAGKRQKLHIEEANENTESEAISDVAEVFESETYTTKASTINSSIERSTREAEKKTDRVAHGNDVVTDETVTRECVVPAARMPGMTVPHDNHDSVPHHIVSIESVVQKLPDNSMRLLRLGNLRRALPEKTYEDWLELKDKISRGELDRKQADTAFEQIMKTYPSAIKAHNALAMANNRKFDFYERQIVVVKMAGTLHDDRNDVDASTLEYTISPSAKIPKKKRGIKKKGGRKRSRKT